MRRDTRSLAPVLCGALLFGAQADAQLASPRPDVYAMTDVGGTWFQSDEAAVQGRDIWLLPGSGSRALLTQCEIRLTPSADFTPGEFVDIVMAMSSEEYASLLSGALPNISELSARERVQIDGLPAVTHTVQAAINGAPTTWLSVFMYRAGHMVTAMCGTPADGFQRVRPAFDDFIDQIRFASDGPAAVVPAPVPASAPASAVAPAAAPAPAASDRCDRGEIGGEIAIAVNLDCRALVSELIASGVDPNEPNFQGYSLLALAAALDHADMARLLVAAGADVNGRDSAGDTALGSAASAGHETTLRTLLELGADPNIADDAGATPIYSAAAFGADAVVRRLLDAGATPGGQAYAGQTPLIVAARGGYASIVRMLLEAGADVAVRTFAGETALDVATSEAVRQLLLDAGARE